MEQEEGRNDGVIEHWERVRSPEKINTITHLGSQFYLPMAVEEWAVVGHKYLKHSFCPPLVLN